MHNSFNFLTRAGVCAFALFLAASCKDSDEFFSPSNSGNSDVEEANTFDFSTTRQVDLIVDYSDFKVYGPVKFSIYSANPIVNENEYNEYVNESIDPIFEAYTGPDGKFDATITLPSYAKVLHIVTGNFMIGLKRKAVEVVNGVAKLKLDAGVSAARGLYDMTTRASGAGVETNNVSVLPWLSFNFKKGGTTSDTRVYKDWHTPLGTWNSSTGRPSYLLDPSTANPELVFPDEVMDGLYATACEALNSGTTCKEDYRASADLTLIKDSEVSIAALGSMTCWNSSFGYYYYTGETVPASTTDLNIIMLFPNTQDGHRYTPKFGSQYQNNIGMVRGDMIQLMYYPNIANGDYSEATKIFPKGTKIGFILKPNSWGNQGDTYCTKNSGKVMNSKMNIWAASTEGLSYCNQDMATYKLPNTTGEARTAKFAYTSPNGNSYSIISVEDACDDKDYDDLLFALNPANVFKELPTVEVGKTTSHGVYAFEDKWPQRGDYDMNDVMLDYQHEMEFNNKGNVTKEKFYFTTYQNYVTLKSGLALKLQTQATPSSIVMKKKAPGANEQTVNFTKDGYYYYLTDDITSELGSTYSFEVTYSTAQEFSKLALVEPFLYRDENGKMWEVHLPYKAPTNKMDQSFFKTGDDASNSTTGKYFVRSGDYPFAFYLDNARIEYFLDNILKKENENTPIDTFFPGFIEWSTSKGQNNQDWYLHPAGQ